MGPIDQNLVNLDGSLASLLALIVAGVLALGDSLLGSTSGLAGLGTLGHALLGGGGGDGG